MPPVRSKRWVVLFVWSAWLAMMIVALAGIARYGRNIPLAEDWYLVAPLTGNQTDVAGWLWAQNNEHRSPVPRLILLVLLKATHGDFRAGMVFNVIILGTCAFAMIRVARHLRGGRTVLADAFFPIVLLHMGHWENLVWSWQLSFVVPVALVCGLLMVLVLDPTLSTPAAVVFTGTCSVLLPLCGAMGLIPIPFLALWLGLSGRFHRLEAKARGECNWMGTFLIGSASAGLCVAGLYFIGYEHPSWNPPNPGFGATIMTSAKFLALGFGPVAARSWTLSVPVALGILIAGMSAGVSAVLGHRGLERRRALGMLSFSAALVLFALAMGYGRAGLVPKVGLPMRYALLSAPVFCTAFFVWELHGRRRLVTAFQTGLLLVMCFLLPFNMMAGFHGFGRWYVRGMEAVKQDVMDGAPSSLLAERHHGFLIHWWDHAVLAQHMRMLHEAKIGLFAQMREDGMSNSPGHSQ